ncbi:MULTISPECIES: exopolyphosphatase [Vibrio]|jgi:nanoRNase/pAp phosphatase (c-di-AMP/oligoRNAs hydrolase)|uniref:Exopolyphosphatase n=1 Tax=Vibrio vulnificus TaxID=672 RepID=A0A6N4AWN8_VIBVL|nr:MULTISPECIES: exopolyphosphatase [Vibrio]ASJ40557.1 exopolyphosphatase [Vibrio vulnificus]EGQ7693599.1 exopolyphosphatase [Vibrio vulnificus]EGQ7756153.1 exopolyphosphatase [Vibrio vulnificus]EGQ7834728.1 exopolyphosphatase [Vibrio vulnificus]EGQ7853883.1 exopolyphosphatase [Vibrio vulnificus]
MSQQKFRLVTRSDFDGLVCAVLLKQQDLIDEIKFVHPKDMQDGLIDITENDIVTNLPYVAEAHLVFDHHLSETIRNRGRHENHIINPNAPSAARVVWDYYGGTSVFPVEWIEMMEAVDKGDSAQFSRDDVLDSKGWNLLNFLMDARTGLGRFREFRISNYNLMMDLIDYCKNHTIEQILDLPDVKERIDLYREHEIKFKEQIQRCATVHKNLVLLDLTNEETIYAGNRFIIYALFPDCNISIHKMWGFQKQNVVFATGKSIFDRGSKTNVGELMLKYGGGGHQAAGTCQINLEDAERVQAELIEQINRDG